MLFVGLLLAVNVAFPTVAMAQTVPDENTLPDFAVIDGYYFSEAAGDDPAKGYTVTNDGGIAFWSAFQQLGGVDAVGYPATGRFVWNGFVDQAMQKLIFQWDPATTHTDIVNTFDVLEQLGLDPMLQAKYQTPPAFDNHADAGKSWDQVKARHLAELDWNPAIKARYFADSDPIDHFGLPQSYADEGNVLVVRCQRAVIQQWKVDVPWAAAGEVTIANGGDIAKAAGVLPAGAATPTAASSLIVGPFGQTLTLSDQQEQTVRAVANTLRSSLVKITVPESDGSFAFGTGMVIDPNGYVLTDAHVVEGSTQAQVLLPDGRTLPGQVVGHDALADVAVLHVSATGLHAVTPGASSALHKGDLLATLGYSDYYPTPPALKVGQVLEVVPINYGGAPVDRIVGNVATLFGDSGSPLVNLQGQTVGVVTQIFYERVQGKDVAFTVDNGFDGDLAIAKKIMATGQSIIRAITGFDDVPMTPAIAAEVQLPYVPGVLVVDVDPDSSAYAAGIRPGDVVTSLDHTPTDAAGAVGTVLSRHKPGDRIAVTFVDPSGGQHSASFTLGGA